MESINRFDYITEKILDSEFREFPFNHIYIENLFSEKDFNEIINCRQIKLKQSKNDKDIFKNLFKNDYKVIGFPGCTMDYKKYIRTHLKGKSLKVNETCESAGIVLRLIPSVPILIELDQFLASEDFNKAIAQKFNINYQNCNIDCGIQKYLDGYEISPHPDIRRKAATYMVNINPHPESEGFNHHTKYLTFKSEYKYIQSFWEEFKEAERNWIPWECCDIKFIQEKNNSMVLFSPSDDTLHGVKANYDHLITQRTQLYGNLWYSENPNILYSPKWNQLKNKDFFAKDIKKEDDQLKKGSFSKRFINKTKGKIKSLLGINGKEFMEREF